jgi:hypothetical protein
MLGEFIDDYTVEVIDVFSMPQSGTGVSVEAVDPVFQVHHLLLYFWRTKTNFWVFAFVDEDDRHAETNKPS